MAVSKIRQAQSLMPFDGVIATLGSSLNVLATTPESASAAIKTAASVCNHLYSLSVELNVELFEELAEAIKSSNRWVRDLVTWRAFALEGLVSSDKYLTMLQLAFGNALVDVHCDRRLRSQMIQSWTKVKATLSPPVPDALPTSKRTRPKRTRPRPSSKSRVKLPLSASSAVACPVCPTPWDEPWRC